MRRPRSPLALLAAVQVAALVFVGGLTVARFHVWAPIDESAHYAYVQELAEERRLPQIGRDLVSPQVAAINDGTWPGPSPRGVPAQPHGGSSYEAMQPPLYYALATPAFAVRSDHREKVFAVRAFDLALLLLSAGLLWLLARTVFGARALAPFTLGMSVLLWPGVVVRSVTVSNDVLAVPLGLLFALALVRATRERSAPWLLAAAATAGALLLTKLTLAYLVPLLAVPAIGLLRERRRVLPVAAAAALPLLMLAPWLASNLARYDAPTGNAIHKRIIGDFLKPAGETYGVGDVVDSLPLLLRSGVPQEWWPDMAGAGGVAVRLLPLLVVALLLAGLVRRRDTWRTHEAALLGLPVLLGVAALAYGLLAEQWPVFLPRYLHAALPGLALFAAFAWRRAGGGDRAIAGTALAGTGLGLGAWAYFVLAHFFTDLGASVGITGAG